jgi:hypothetical protein
MRVPAGEGERLRFSDVEIVVRVPSEATGGAFSLFEEHAPADTGWGRATIFRELAAADPLDDASFARISERYGITWVG